MGWNEDSAKIRDLSDSVRDARQSIISGEQRHSRDWPLRKSKMLDMIKQCNEEIDRIMARYLQDG